MNVSLQEFLAVNPATDVINGNTAWARTYAREIQRVVYTYANSAPPESARPLRTVRTGYHV